VKVKSTFDVMQSSALAQVERLFVTCFRFVERALGASTPVGKTAGAVALS